MAHCIGVESFFIRVVSGMLAQGFGTRSNERINDQTVAAILIIVITENSPRSRQRASMYSFERWVY